MIPQDLRIGNKVFIPATKQNAFISAIDGNIGVKVNNSPNYLSLDEIEPIQLTEEILLKYGFENGGYDLLFWYKDNIEIFGFNHVDEELPLILMPYTDKESLKIYYLHQLQNAYYSLTNKELEIKL